MSQDAIVDEVRAAREAYAARFDFDLDAIHRTSSPANDRAPIASSASLRSAFRRSPFGPAPTTATRFRGEPSHPAGRLTDPVLSLPVKDGWPAVRPSQGYLQHDDESVGWAVVIQWVNPDRPPPPEFDVKNWPAHTLPMDGPAPIPPPRVSKDD